MCIIGFAIKQPGLPCLCFCLFVCFVVIFPAGVGFVLILVCPLLFIPAPLLLPAISSITPLRVDQFELELRDHPHRQQVSFVLEGLHEGFKLGYFHPRKLKSATKNKSSACQHPSVVDSYLANEVSLGRVAGPFSSPPVPNLHISSFGVIPKEGQPGKWRLIVDLSSPRGSSVNDGIFGDELTMQYIRLNQVIHNDGLMSWLGSVDG